jgi:hypothetical protein
MSRCAPAACRRSSKRRLILQPRVSTNVAQSLGLTLHRDPCPAHSADCRSHASIGASAALMNGAGYKNTKYLTKVSSSLVATAATGATRGTSGTVAEGARRDLRPGGDTMTDRIHR